MKCALCFNGRFEEVSNVDAKSSERLLVSMCEKCGLIQQIPIPIDDELRSYYSHNYRKDYKNVYTPKSKHVYRAGKTAIQRIKFLKGEVKTTGALLDVGAGGGEFVYLAEKNGFQSQGIEPSIGYSKYAKNKYNCKVMTGQLEDVESTYDIITAFHVLEHLPSPTRAFEKLYYLLNTQGKLLVEVPWIETNDASPHNIYFKAHIFYFSVDTLVACASQFFYVLKIDTASNLKILFQARTEPTSVKLPSTASVDKLRIRLKKKGWMEYLVKGRGILKPIKKVTRIIEESKARRNTPKDILDEVITG